MKLRVDKWNGYYYAYDEHLDLPYEPMCIFRVTRKWTDDGIKALLHVWTPHFKGNRVKVKKEIDRWVEKNQIRLEMEWK